MPLSLPVRALPRFLLVALVGFALSLAIEADAVPGVNDAPALDNSKTPELLPVFANSGPPSGAVGTLVSTLVDFTSPAGQVDNATDADDSEGDPAPGLGIAIVAADAANGTWRYSTNGGATWNLLGAVSTSSARTLPAGSRLHFQPNPAISGTATVTFRAWDQTAGTAGGTLSTLVNGGSSSVSTATDIASVTVVGPILFRSATSNGTGGASSLTLTKPTGTLAGDILVATIVAAPFTTTVMPPGGWSLARRVDQASGATLSLLTYVKLAGASEPVSYAWGFSSAIQSTGGIAAFLNVDGNNPIDVEAGQTTASSLSHAAPSITATLPRTMLHTLHSYRSSGTWTPPGGMTEAIDDNSEGVTGAVGVSLSANYQLLAASGLTGARTAAASNDADVGASESIALRPVNVAPALDAARSPAFVAENVGTEAPMGAVGTLVSALVDLATAPGGADNVVDGDEDAVTGLAITGTNTANGTWHYSLDGINWTALGAVSDAAAFLLSADADNRLYFRPTVPFTGALADAITFRAWDRTTGASGSTGDASINGGSTAFSRFTDTASLSVTATAIAPTATNLSAAESYTEDTALNLVNIVVTDPDSPVTATLTLSNTSAGSLSTATSGATTSTFSAGVWTASGPVADVNTLLAGVTFLPASNFNAGFSIVTSVGDGSGSVTGSKAVTGTPVNDAPTATNLSAAQTYVEDTGLNLVDIVVTDVDSPTITATLVVSNPSAGALSTGTSGAVTSTYSAGVWSASGAIADVNALLAGVGFVPTANFNATFSIGTSVTDNVAAPVSGTKAMAGTPVNDAPSATNLSAGETYTEDQALNLTDIVASDVDSGNLTATLTLSNLSAGSLSTGTSGAVTSTFSAGVWTASGAIANVNTLLGGVVFTPAANFNAGFSIGTSVSDNVAAPVTGSKAMTGTPVNDAPSATNLSAPENYTEDTPLDFTDIAATDVDGGTLTATLTLSNVSAGSLSTGTSGPVTSTFSSGVWSAAGPIANVNALLAGVTLSPALDFSGNFVLLTSVSDGVAAPVTGTKVMNGIAVNDAPTASNLSTPETYTEDTSLNLVNIVASDVDSPSLMATLTLSNSSAGSLSTGTSGAVTSTFGAGVWSASGALADVNALLAGVVFVPAPNFSAGFTIATAVSDGVALPVTGAKTMTGLGLNDAPTASNLSTAQVYIEDTALDLTDIVVSDVDSGNLTATLTLSNVAAGSMSTATSGPVTSTFSAGVWSAAGPIAPVNALLAGVTFAPAPDFHADFTIATSVSDGVAAPVTGLKLMSGTAVNDAPLLGDGTLAPVEPDTIDPPGQPVATIFAGQFADVDGDSSVTGIAVVANAADAGSEGTWEYSANEGTDWFAIGAVADGPTALALSAATLVRFVPAPAFTGAPTSLVVRGLDDTYGGGFSTTEGGETRLTVDTGTSGGATAIAGTVALLGTSVAGVVAVPGDDLPLAFALGEPFPNPSRGAVHLHFALPQPARVQMILLDVRGRQVARLADADYPAGRFQLAWDGRSNGNLVTSGIYFARLVTPWQTLVRRIVIAR